jgi:hypothetical protein
MFKLKYLLKAVETLYIKSYPDMEPLRSDDNLCVNSFVENLYIDCNDIYGLVDPNQGPEPANIKERNIEVPLEKFNNIDLGKEGFDYRVISKIIGETAEFVPIPFDKTGLREK